MGVDRHVWNDWIGLATDISQLFYHFPSRLLPNFTKLEASRKQYEEWVRQQYRMFFEGTLGTLCDEPHVPIVPYNARLKRYGIDLAALSPADGERINQGRREKGQQELNWDRVRRLDELAKLCNESIRTSVYEEKPFEWRKLHAYVLEASELIYGEPCPFLKDFTPI